MVDSIFADLTKPGSPGCALGVYRNDKIIYSRGYGLANIEENVPITPQSVFDVASLSLIVKRVTGQSLRQFAAENIFRPLAMTHTTYRDDHTMLIPNRALAYDRSEMAITN